MADAYALVKTITLQGTPGRLGLVVNMCRTAEEGRAVLDRLALVSAQFLGVRLRPIGWIPRDERVPAAVRRREPFAQAWPNCPASRSLKEIATVLGHSACRTRNPSLGLGSAVERLRRAFLTLKRES
jgi:flagellar biosynthesis protein FlhG